MADKGGPLASISHSINIPAIIKGLRTKRQKAEQELQDIEGAEQLIMSLIESIEELLTEIDEFARGLQGKAVSMRNTARSRKKAISKITEEDDLA